MEQKKYGYVRVSTKEQNEDRQIKTMIELGIPRETALYLYKVAFKGKQKGSDKKTLEQKIRDRLGNIIETLPYWVQVQLDFLI